MQSHATLFLKFVLVIISIATLALYLVVLPSGISAELRKGFDFDFGVILVLLYLPAIPFFVALRFAFRVLTLIAQGDVFSVTAITAVRTIKRCALAITGSLAVGLPYAFHLAEIEDAPGLFAFSLAFVFIAIVITTATAVLQEVLQHAVDLQSEHDLTV